MMHLPDTLHLPLKRDDHGIIRVSGTRVTLHTVLSAYNAGMDAMTIHEGFPTVPLADIHAVISYYLANRDALDAYLHDIDDQANQIQREWESRYTPEQKARTEVFRRLADAKDDVD